MMRPIVLAMLAASVSFHEAAAQQSGPPTAPPPRTQSDYYVPLFGVTGAISIPVGRLSDDHAAGYGAGGLVEYAVSGQPYSLRGEVTLQHFPLKSGRTGDASNLLSVGSTIIYRLDQTTTQGFVSGGIAIYNATHEGTRPGFNLGGGVEIPLTGFSAIAEVRLHVMLADAKPIMAIPLTVGVRF
ncbi:MAG: hypothetical protein V4550_13355 [Gemmatimonadota bacterium]